MSAPSDRCPKCRRRLEYEHNLTWCPGCAWEAPTNTKNLVVPNEQPDNEPSTNELQDRVRRAVAATPERQPMATIDEIGAATLQTLRTTLGKVRQAERLVEEAEAQLQAARASTAEEAGKLSRALGALGVEIPADLATPLRAILYPPRGRGAARPMAAVPAQTCPDCSQPVKGVGGLAIHRARSHKAS